MIVNMSSPGNWVSNGLSPWIGVSTSWSAIPYPLLDFWVTFMMSNVAGLIAIGINDSLAMVY